MGAEFRVQTTISDPWEFRAADGSTVFPRVEGKALASTGDGEDFPVLLDFGTPVVTSQGSARFFVATPNGDGLGAFVGLLRGDALDCSLVGINDDAAEAADAALAAAGAWRGGRPLARATLRLADGS